jgi:hypothetical protein
VIIFQSQPTKVYPNLINLHKEMKKSIDYEYSTIFSFNNNEDHSFMFNADIITYNFNEKNPKKISDQNFDPFYIRIKNQDFPIDASKQSEINYLFGLFDFNFIEKKSTDFSFTIIDNPLNQCVNLFLYLKSIFDQESYERLLPQTNLNPQEFKKNILTNLNENEFDFTEENFIKSEDYNPNLTFKYYLIFYKEKLEKNLEAKLHMRVIYREFLLFLIFKSIYHIKTIQDWIDYFISNPSLKNLISYQNRNFSISKTFFNVKNLYKNHNFYGIMDTKENLAKSLKFISHKTNYYFYLDKKYNQNSSPIEYRKKELAQVLEEDIYIFNKKKEILNGIHI